jgi:hypothetical protein
MGELRFQRLAVRLLATLGVAVGLATAGVELAKAIPRKVTPPPPPAQTVPLGKTVLLGRRTRTKACKRGALPDRRCSPGAYYSKLTQLVICSSSFRTGSVRNVPQSEKYADEREYGMPAKSYGRTIEIDHIVSLELGGSNDIANLYPEPGSGKASYHVKDKLENKLHSLVCSGSMTLSAARRGIATQLGEALRASLRLSAVADSEAHCFSQAMPSWSFFRDPNPSLTRPNSLTLASSSMTPKPEPRMSLMMAQF